jgi:hypothetical protein
VKVEHISGVFCTVGGALVLLMLHAMRAARASRSRRLRRPVPSLNSRSSRLFSHGMAATPRLRAMCMYVRMILSCHRSSDFISRPILTKLWQDLERVRIS